MRAKAGLVLIVFLVVMALLAALVLTAAEDYYDYVVFHSDGKVSGAALSDRGLRLFEVDGGRIRAVRKVLDGHFNRLEAFYNRSKPFIAGIDEYGVVFMGADGTKTGGIGLNKDEMIIDMCFYPDKVGAEIVFLIIGGPGQWYGHSIRAYDITGGYIELYKRDMSEYGPWKVQAADVDGDGDAEVSVGVYKTARFHPVMAKRPFVYAWDGTDLKPKWLGSRLSRPFDDFIFGDLDGNGSDEIIAIERLEDGACIVQSYEWTGFGFIGMAESGVADGYRRLTVLDGVDGPLDKLIVIRETGDKTTIDVLAYRDGKLEQESAIDCPGAPGRVMGFDGSIYYILDGQLMVR